MAHPNCTEIELHEFFKRKIFSCAVSRAKQPRQRISREKSRKRSTIINLFAGDEITGNEESTEHITPTTVQTVDNESNNQCEETTDAKTVELNSCSESRVQPLHQRNSRKKRASNDSNDIVKFSTSATPCQTKTFVSVKRQKTAGKLVAKRIRTSKMDCFDLDPQYLVDENASDFGSELSDNTDEMVSMLFICTFDLYIFIYLVSYLYPAIRR